MEAGPFMRQATPAKLFLLPLALAASLAGCATEPPVSTPVPAPVPAVRPAANVYFYPLHGQSAAQQDRDRYECYLWARRQTGYDPSRPPYDGGPPVQVVAVPPPGQDVAAGAVTGAIFGAAVSHPWDSAEGAVIGAVAGAMVGAASGSSRQREAERIEAEENAERARSAAQVDATVLRYRDAMKACLAARGYTVQ